MKKIFRYYDVTFWNFCIIVMRKDCFCPPAERADFRRKNHVQIRAIRGDKEPLNKLCYQHNAISIIFVFLPRYNNSML